MGKMQRIRSFLRGLFTLLVGIAMLFLNAEQAFELAAVILSIGLLVKGSGMLWYYFTMARNMVGGKLHLYVGFIILDFGMFTFTMTNVPHLYLMLYMFASHGFGGAIDILRGLESRKNESPSWKLNVSRGIVNLAVALLSLLFLNRTWVLVYLYCTGLIYSAAARMITAFRHTEIVYIQ